jgi:hypothetical protein
MHDSPTPNLCGSVNPKEPQYGQFAYGLLMLELVALHLHCSALLLPYPSTTHRPLLPHSRFARASNIGDTHV